MDAQSTGVQRHQGVDQPLTRCGDANQVLRQVFG